LEEPFSVLEVDDLPSTVQGQLFEELLDKEVQSQLEEDPPVVNWALEITDRLGKTSQIEITIYPSF